MRGETSSAALVIPEATMSTELMILRTIPQRKSLKPIITTLLEIWTPIGDTQVRRILMIPAKSSQTEINQTSTELECCRT